MINISSNHIKLHVYDDDVKEGKIVTSSMIINHYFEVFIYFFSVNFPYGNDTKIEGV